MTKQDTPNPSPKPHIGFWPKALQVYPGEWGTGRDRGLLKVPQQKPPAPPMTAVGGGEQSRRDSWSHPGAPAGRTKLKESLPRALSLPLKILLGFPSLLGCSSDSTV